MYAGTWAPRYSEISCVWSNARTLQSIGLKCGNGPICDSVYALSPAWALLNTLAIILQRWCLFK